MNLRWFQCVGVLSLIMTVSCGKKKESPQIFFGKCKIEIESKDGKHSEIRLDGIKVGYDKVALEAPCGEKRVTVVEAGKATYDAYHNVAVGQPLLVKVELKKIEEEENFALSRNLVAQARTGQKIDPKAAIAPIKDPAPGSAVSESDGGAAGGVGGSSDTKNLNPDGTCAKWCSASDWT